jgi:hypothetical protein
MVSLRTAWSVAGPSFGSIRVAEAINPLPTAVGRRSLGFLARQNKTLEGEKGSSTV